MIEVTCTKCKQKQAIDAGGFFGAVQSAANEAKFHFICDPCLPAVAAECVGPILRAKIVGVRP